MLCITICIAVCIDEYRVILLNCILILHVDRNCVTIDLNKQLQLHPTNATYHVTVINEISSMCRVGDMYQLIHQLTMHAGTH